MSTEQESTRKTLTQGRLHRPADDILDKPQLKVKPVGSRQGPEEAGSSAMSVAEEAAATTNAQAATIVIEHPEPAAAPAPAEPPAEMAQAPQEAPTADLTAVEEPRKPVKLPRIEPNKDALIYATHQPAPPDERAEKAHLAALTGRRAKEREVSLGFMVGVVAIVLLVGGILFAGMSRHVRRLESRVSALEQGQGRTQTAAVSRLR
jgi:pyruvate/2-oxoglutarate dehydrogenase complex dihydrolipoamide acyltransferase (E2) component